MTFDKQSNTRWTVVESKSNRSYKHRITVDENTVKLRLHRFVFIAVRRRWSTRARQRGRGVRREGERGRWRRRRGRAAAATVRAAGGRRRPGGHVQRTGVVAGRSGGRRVTRLRHVGRRTCRCCWRRRRLADADVRHHRWRHGGRGQRLTGVQCSGATRLHPPGQQVHACTSNN